METVKDCGMDGSEFCGHLEQQGFAFERHSSGGWIIWRRPPPEVTSLSLENRFFKDNTIETLLVEMASYLCKQFSLVQFWALEQHPRNLYLTTFDQPFLVGDQTFYGYRQLCMRHRYRVDEGANEEELGSVGRVYKNKRPESSPDLRLYSANEFPFRDDAHAYGLTSYCAIPVFDMFFGNFHGVIEIFHLKNDVFMFTRIKSSLQAACFKTSHLNFWGSAEDVDAEIVEMIQCARKVTPQLQMTHVWTPCRECCNMSDKLSCMQRDITVGDVSDDDMLWYREACGFHHLQIVMSGNKPRICRNVCDFRISENPLAHYAQKARLSFCFTVRLESLDNCGGDFKVVEFILHCNSREDEFSKICLPLLLSVMEMKLKKYKFAYDGELGNELNVEVSESNGLRYESIKYEFGMIKAKEIGMIKAKEIGMIKAKELGMIKSMEGCGEIYSPSDFTEYLSNANLHYSEPPAEREVCGWVFWSQTSENQSSLGFDVNERIKWLMNTIAFRRVMTSEKYAVAQFWAPKWDGDRCYLEVSGQPFALDQLRKGSADFRKQCMGHRYYVAKDKLGPPGRVYQNGYPEITPDLRLYSPKEFPLRDDAACYGLISYVALPIFKLNTDKCIGVLELLSTDNYTCTKVVGKELEAAGLSSTHTTNFRPGSLTTGDNDEYQELALTEIGHACELFAAIPQLYIVEVWVPCNKCPSNNNADFCMERALTTEEGAEWHPPLRGVQHVKIGKGIAGMALASENKSCFCLHSCRFSISDQPLSHFTRRARLDVCFAICLQSRHTGDLVYILHFYLNGSSHNYKYFNTFLCSLLQIMKQRLISFKVASGQELGEKLVVEVIEISQEIELDCSEADQPDGLPITFKFVPYPHAPEHSEDKKAESVRIVALEERGQCSTATTNLKTKETEGIMGKRKTEAKDIKGRKGKKKKTATDIREKKKKGAKDIEGRTGEKKKGAKDIEGIKGEKKKGTKGIEGRKGEIKKVAKDMEGRKGEKKKAAKDIEGKKMKAAKETKATGKIEIPLEMLKSVFGMKLEDARKILGVSRSTMKRARDLYGLKRWPSKESHKNNLSLFMKDQNISNLPPTSVTADPQSSLGPIVERKVDIVVIRAKYEDDTVRVELCRSEGVKKLLNEVGRKLKLIAESFKLKYMDEAKFEILLACDDDLQHFLKISDKPYVQVYRKVIPPRAVEFVDDLPLWTHEYVVGTTDVPGDGHCGFHVVAKQMGFEETGAWRRVRRELMKELRVHRDLYSKVFIEKKLVDDVMSRLNNFKAVAPEYNWFVLPEMGHLVASTYNVILVTLSNSMCYTFLPFRTMAPTKPKCICIGLLDQRRHFIEVTLRPGHPLPHIIYPWEKYRVGNAATWSDFCQKQISLYHQLVGFNPDANKQVINV